MDVHDPVYRITKVENMYFAEVGQWFNGEWKTVVSRAFYVDKTNISEVERWCEQTADDFYYHMNNQIITKVKEDGEFQDYPAEEYTDEYVDDTWDDLTDGQMADAYAEQCQSEPSFDGGDY